MRGSPLLHLALAAVAFLLLGGTVWLLSRPAARPEATPEPQATRHQPLDLQFTAESPTPLRSLQLLAGEEILWKNPPASAPPGQRLSGECQIPADARDLVWQAEFATKAAGPVALRLRFRVGDAARQEQIFWGSGDHLEGVTHLEGASP